MSTEAVGVGRGRGRGRLLFIRCRKALSIMSLPVDEFD